MNVSSEVATGERENESKRQREKEEDGKDTHEGRWEVAVGMQKAHKTGLQQKLQKSLAGCLPAYLPTCLSNELLHRSRIKGLIPQNLQKHKPRNTNHKTIYKLSVTNVRPGQAA